MAAYFNGQHHPQQALLPRVGYVALAGDAVIGYIAGNRTTRHACQCSTSLSRQHTPGEGLPQRCFGC